MQMGFKIHLLPERDSEEEENFAFLISMSSSLQQQLLRGREFIYGSDGFVFLHHCGWDAIRSFFYLAFPRFQILFLSL